MLLTSTVKTVDGFEDRASGSVNGWFRAPRRSSTDPHSPSKTRMAPCRASIPLPFPITRLGRRGRPRIEQDADGTVWVGGPASTSIQGGVEL